MWCRMIVEEYGDTYRRGGGGSDIGRITRPRWGAFLLHLRVTRPPCPPRTTKTARSTGSLVSHQAT